MPVFNIKDFGAEGDGTTNDAPAFAEFNSVAVLESDPVTLIIPPGEYSFSTTVAQFFCKGISTLGIIGSRPDLVTFKNNVVGDHAFFFGGTGVIQDNAHSARIETVERGSNFIVLNDVDDAGLFFVGQLALLTGFDLQGIFGAPFGYPQNSHRFQHVVIADISGTSITVVGLVNGTYKSTWPNYNSGNGFQVDPGGPATLYALDPSFDARVVVSGITIDNPNFQTYAVCREITYYNVVCTGAPGIIPTQNMVWSAIGCDLSTCTMEVDKLIGHVRIRDTDVDQVKVQSSSVDRLTVEGSCAINAIIGTPKRTFIRGGTIGLLRPGAYAFGRSDFLYVKSPATIGAIEYAPASDAGFGAGADIAYSVSGNAIRYPNGKTVTGAADNGSGKVRLALTNTNGLASGERLNISGVGGTTEANGGAQEITVIDGTHVDLLAVSFAHAYTSGGALGLFAPQWAVPGTQIICPGKIFEVVDVAQSATETIISTDGVDELPESLRVHPCPSATFEDVTGCDDVVSFSQAPVGAPLYSFQTRTYTSGVAKGDEQAKFSVIGRIASVSINVTNAYAGAGNLLFSLAQFNNWPVTLADGSSYNFGPVVNAKIAGERIITPSGVTGAKSGDAGLTIPEAFWFDGLSDQGSIFSADVSGTDANVRVVVTIRSDQEHGGRTFVCNFS